jgi:HlyD family secretion protein
MTIPKFLKRKSTYITLAIIVVLGCWYSFNRSKSSKPVYETSNATRQNLLQTVEVTGEIKPAERIDLSFERSGKISSINVKVGQVVKKGDILAQLNTDDVAYALKNASAALAQSKATLNQRIAGETSQSIRISETNVEKAKAAYDKAVSDLAATKLTVNDDLNSAKLALDAAKNKLDDQTATLDQSLLNAIDTKRVALLTALGPLQTGMSDGDAIAGVDDTATNSQYRSLLGIYDGSTMPKARQSYQAAKPVKLDAETDVRALTANSTPDQIQSASDKLQQAISLVQSFLGDVQKVLATSIAGPNFSSADLAAKRTAIDTDRASISVQYAAVLTASQTVKNVTLTNADSKQQLKSAYDTAKVNFNIAQTNVTTEVVSAQANVSIQKAALDSAQADLNLKKTPVRASDLAPLRAAVQQAQVAVDKAQNDMKNGQITSPVDGIVSEVLPAVGEQVVGNVAAFRMVGTQSYDIEAQVPEADIPKIEIQQKATITLDAFGDDVKFNGVVTAKDPAETRVQDAIYYKIRVQIDPAGKEVKPGMTANVTIVTAESDSTIVIPLRAVRTDTTSQAKTVRSLVGGKPQDRVITLGLKGDEGLVEVLTGIQEGEAVIVSDTTAATK